MKKGLISEIPNELILTRFREEKLISNLDDEEIEEEFSERDLEIELSDIDDDIILEEFRSRGLRDEEEIFDIEFYQIETLNDQLKHDLLVKAFKKYSLEELDRILNLD